MSAPPAAPDLRIGGEAVGLRQLGPDFLRAVPDPARRLAEQLPIARRHRLPSGQWQPESLSAADNWNPYALLVLEGLVVRDVVLAGRASACLFGPGDVLRPWRRPDGTVTTTSLWSSSGGGAVVAVLGDGFVRAGRKWPGLSRLIRDRLDDQLDAATLQTAILSLPRAEQRVLALLWHLADRWGTVTPDGVLVPLPLTHDLIGRTVGARRPTVTLALQMLAENGTVTKASQGEWCLAHGSHLEIEPAETMASLTSHAASG